MSSPMISPMGAVYFVGTENVTSLLSGETDGLAIHAFSETTTLAAQIKDTGTPAHNYLGPLSGLFASTVFPDPKMCKQLDGSWKYSPHNQFTYSSTFSDASWTKTTTIVTASQVGPDGATTDASLLTATGTTSAIAKAVTGRANETRSAAIKAKAGTSSFLCIELSDGSTHRTWFNLSTGSVATNEAGNTAEISALGDDGLPLASGWYMCRVRRTAAAPSVTYKFYQVDADNSTSVTSGRTISVARAQTYRGVLRLAYVATTSAALSDVPYDWTHSARAMLIEETGVTYNGLWSNDLTQAGSWTISGAGADGTAVLNATGPDGEQCSSFTAANANATITQAITSASTIQSFSPAIRRKTGSGAVFITINGGTNWTDVTSQIGAVGGAYGRPFILGSATNPTIGFKLATAGDAVEIAWANCATNGAAVNMISSPLATYAVSLARAADLMRVPLSSMPSGSEMTLFADVHLSDAALNNYVGFQGTNYLLLNPNATRLQLFSNPSVQHWYQTLSVGQRLQAALRRKPNDNAVAANGYPTSRDSNVGAGTVTDIRVGGTCPIWLRRLVVVPYVVDFDVLRTWRLDKSAQGVASHILANCYVEKFGELANTTTVRQPAGVKLYETASKVGLMVFAAPRNSLSNVDNVELPRKLMGRRYEFDKGTYEITPLEAMQEFYKQVPKYDAGYGTAQAPNAHLIKQGPHAGRMIVLFTQDDSVTGDILANFVRNLYVKISDDGGATFSAPVKILDVSQIPGASYIIAGENGSNGQITTGAHANRIIFPIYTDSGVRCVWTDDGGTSWGFSTTGVSATPAANVSISEPSLTVLPTGDIVMFCRDDNATGGNTKGWIKSTDGGDTLVWQGLLSGVQTTTACNSAAAQLDPTGAIGASGVVLLGVPERATNPARGDYTIYKTVDGGVTLTNPWEPLTADRQAGYSCLVPLYDDVVAMVWEAGCTDTVFNSNESVSLTIMRYPYLN